MESDLKLFMEAQFKFLEELSKLIVTFNESITYQKASYEENHNIIITLKRLEQKIDLIYNQTIKEEKCVKQ